MFAQLRKGRFTLALALVAAFCLVFAAPALAEDVTTYNPDTAKLTKIIDGALDTDASLDEYVFQFAGGGEVKDGNVNNGEEADKIYSDGVAQDLATIKVGDTVPTIPDVKLNGVEFSANNTLSNGQVAQAAVQKSLTSIFTENNVTFPHAGVFTYVVSEKGVNLGATSLASGVYVNASKAEYILRVRVSNSNVEANSTLGNRALTIESVTIEKTKDDNGNDVSGKIDPEYPTTTNTNKIEKTAADKTPAADTLAGDGRGRDVEGFSFANEYIQGGSFVVKKLYDGDHSDRTMYSTVKLAVYSEAAKNPDAQGACLTYVIEGDGIDNTNNLDTYGEHTKLNGIEQGIAQENHYMVEFNTSGWAYIEAQLKEDSLIRVTGEFGPFNPSYAQEAPNGKDKRMTLSTSGLLVGQDFYVIESTPGDYVPTGYVYAGDANGVDPRVDATGMTKTQKLNSAATDPTDTSEDPAQILAGGLLLNDSATGSATTVFVVNTIDEARVSPTGILINNLPYILMIGIPVAVFAVMFVNKRRASAEA